MNILVTSRISTRLAAGFAVILALSIVSTLIGIWQLRAVSDATREMMEKPLTKERMAADWYRNTFGSIRRTSAIAKSSDDSLPKFFAKDIEETTKSSSELQKNFEALLTSEEEKALYNKVVEVRKKYSKARDGAIKAKAEGNAAESNRLLEEEYLPLSKQYEDGLLELLTHQRKAIDQNALDIEHAYEGSLKLMILLSVLIVAFGAACSVLIARSITKPLNLAVNLATRVAEGDLTAEVQPKSNNEIGKLLRALKNMNEALRKIVIQVQTGAHAITTASSEIAAGNQDLSSRTEQQASSLEETASSMEELTSTVKQNADNARQANQLAVSASAVAGKGGQVVAEVVDTMASINESSKKIVDIIGVIDGIAFQTNILALNAAVEAARAGEQGRGFAVVASEVRNLAQRSAAAAKEIKALIDDSVQKVDTGSKLVANAGSTMEEIVDSIRRVTDIMGEISAASQEQTSGIDQINQAISQMDQVTQQNASLVEEAAAASEAMQNQAAELSRVVSVFRLGNSQPAGTNLPVGPVKTRQSLAQVPARADRTRSISDTAIATPTTRRPAPAVSGDDWEEF
ncbi:methyl-accepting chemotaxis protein [Noviherbaspirillum massiliense]|uniref:methyl-accepting chemotaxis protein n=1 Tax=Noviherbaspirillum massiliense TaxID=1465823 RepID=UPI0002DE9619|nr:methyl-accepting chemotaxis protein [Noviherbaspirillum massiliense]